MKIRGKTKEEHGLVAILDALGAANFGAAEVEQFLNARQKVLQLLHEKAEDLLDEPSRPQLMAATISTFTFNDTIVITFRSGANAPTLQQVCSFLMVIRKFVVDSLAHGILFRGAVGAGRFHINESTNTVMGEAVSDAAAWYEEAQWIGVHCSPRCSLFIDSLLERTTKKTKTQIMVDFDVPLKGGKSCRLKAVNWPRIFLLPKINPWGSKENSRAKLLELLSAHTIPMGVENKYQNTIHFFDRCMELLAAYESRSDA
jgi:hypothetical protein